jgi:hypothetical protein
MRLSTAGRTQQRKELAIANGDRDVINRPHIRESANHPIDRQCGHPSLASSDVSAYA